MYRKLLSKWFWSKLESKQPTPHGITIDWLKEFADWLDENAAQHGVQRTASQAPRIVTVTGEDGKPEDIAIP
jgi:hypothetical protein